MSSPNVYTILSVPTVISFPSPRCLKWSSAGQLIFTTKSAVYILTPDHGINFDSESLVKSEISNELQGSHKPISWFRTMVQDDKVMDGTRWPELSHAWGAVSLGSIDASIMTVECSPTTASSDGQTVLALLTSNMDISLWKAGKNCLKGEWHRLTDVTPVLLNYFGAQNSPDPSTASVLKSQSTCLCWTSQPNFDVAPHPLVDASLLIVGNRGGSLSILRYVAKESAVSVLQDVDVAETWVTALAASAWTSTSQGSCTALVAFGCGDGSVGYIKLNQFLKPKETHFSFITEYEVSISVESLDEAVLESDKAGITGMEWITTPGGASILVVCKPGVLYLFAPSGVAWSGVRSLELERQPISSAASPYHPAAGICYSGPDDTLTVSLFDGSIHVVHEVSKEPQWSPPVEESSWTSSKLSQICRSIFSKVETGPIDHKVMNRVSGFTRYDSGSTFAWAHESAVPSDFSYKHDAKHSSTIVIARLADMTENQEFVRRLDSALSATAQHSVSSSTLRPAFFGLYNQNRIAAVHDDVLAVLQKGSEDYSVNISLPSFEGELTEELRSNFRQSLATHLFGWEESARLRTRLSLIDFMWKFSSNQERQIECGQVAQGILNSISQRTLRTLIRHAAAVVRSLTADDIVFIMRLISQSHFPGYAPSLQADGQALSEATKHLIPVEQEGNPAANWYTENCPACQVPIPLIDINSAVCANGHTWKRCSITTFILATPWVRTCAGCSRKALLPPSVSQASTGAVQLPPLAKGWLVSELLETVHQCLFCNNTFVSLL